AIYLEMDLAELAIPVLVLRVVSQRVISGAVGDALANGVVQVIAVVEGLAASSVCHLLHGPMDSEQQRCFGAKGGMQIRSPESASVAPTTAVLSTEEGGRGEPPGIHRIDGDLRVNQRLGNLGHFGVEAAR